MYPLLIILPALITSAGLILAGKVLALGFICAGGILTGSMEGDSGVTMCTTVGESAALLGLMLAGTDILL